MGNKTSIQNPARTERFGGSVYFGRRLYRGRFSLSHFRRQYFLRHGFFGAVGNCGEAYKIKSKSDHFGYTVKDPGRYGVIEFDAQGKALSIEEKPEQPKSNQAVVGLYFYPNEVVSIANQITPSGRGELEITAINEHFLKAGKLHVETLGRGFSWLDTGTHESLLEAGQFIETIEKRQGIKIGCLEEVSYQKGYSTKEQLIEQAQKLKGTSYGDYLLERYSH